MNPRGPAEGAFMLKPRYFALSLILCSIPMFAQEPTPPPPAQPAPVVVAPESPPPASPVPPIPTASAPTPTPTPAEQKTPIFRVLDDGQLLESWFGVPVAFTKKDNIDFIWIKPGLNLTGRQIWIRSWGKPLILRDGRDEKDLKQASELTYMFPLLLRNTLSPAFGSRVTLSNSRGDFTLIGRLVDSNAGSMNAKFFVWMGAGSSTATWDIKLIDTKSNELVMAVHHRAVSGSAFTEVQDKIEKWCRRFAQYLSDTVVH
jgi:hypothetical protein